jgi:peptide methionine sulfoxide reductase msrA/msrB
MSEALMLAKPTLLLSALVVFTLFGCRPAEAPAAPGEGARVKPGSSSKMAKPMTPKYSASNYDITPLSPEQVRDLAAKLDPEAYRVTQRAGTEPAFCGNLLDNRKEGVYCCVVCGLPLFSSEHKFHSGTGWPSFYREFDPAHVTRKTDKSHGMIRVEINCARCGAHLGHVFEDGPRPTGERHCLNSASLKFHEKGRERPPESEPVKTEVAYFAGGCFWGIEHYFQEGPAVIDAVSGYMQGTLDQPTYQQVCTDTTGHAETVKVIYDPKRITYRRLLEAFFAMHDPTERNRQGPDVGTQYRSGIWYANDDQKREAETYIQVLQKEKRFAGREIVTRVEPAKTFWPAEDYHQDYIEKTGRACHVANPW